MQNLTETIETPQHMLRWHVVAVMVGAAIMTAAIRAESRHFAAVTTGHHESVAREVEVRHSPPVFGGLRIPSTSSK